MFQSEHACVSIAYTCMCFNCTNSHVFVYMHVLCMCAMHVHACSRPALATCACSGAYVHACGYVRLAAWLHGVCDDVEDVVCGKEGLNDGGCQQGQVKPYQSLCGEDVGIWSQLACWGKHIIINLKISWEYCMLRVIAYIGWTVYTFWDSISYTMREGTCL